MTDRRSQTSRHNLGDHIPEALSPEGSTVVATRLPNDTLARIDATCKEQGITRSEYIRALLERHAGKDAP